MAALPRFASGLCRRVLEHVRTHVPQDRTFTIHALEGLSDHRRLQVALSQLSRDGRLLRPAPRIYQQPERPARSLPVMERARQYIAGYLCGRPFTARDMHGFGTNNNTNLVLSRLTQEGHLIRVRHGVYRAVTSAK